jgi:hypothetical protein
MLDASLARARELNSPIGIAVSLFGLGDLAWDQGDRARSRTLLREALARLRDLEETWSGILCLERLAATRAADDRRVAARHLAAAAAWREAVGLPRPAKEHERAERTLAALRESLGAALFAATWADGYALTPGEAVAEALEA